MEMGEDSSMNFACNDSLSFAHFDYYFIWLLLMRHCVSAVLITFDWFCIWIIQSPPTRPYPAKCCASANWNFCQIYIRFYDFSQKKLANNFLFDFVAMDAMPCDFVNRFPLIIPLQRNHYSTRCFIPLSVPCVLSAWRAVCLMLDVKFIRKPIYCDLIGLRFLRWAPTSTT